MKTHAPTMLQDLIGQSLSDGRYRILSHLGEGSMAYVFMAHDNRLQTEVVIKVPKPEKIATGDFRERFCREGQLMVRLTHPHVVQILDVGEYQQFPFVVMNYLGGGTLKERTVQEDPKNRRATVRSLKTWVREVARALDFVHAQGIVHRDVKPANILFDSHGNAFVSDFGLTKIMYGEDTAANSEMTAAGFVIGTPNYVAPELVLGRPYDGRADQYSLGITVYHALTGSPPMQGANTSATIVNQTSKRLPLLSSVRGDVPEAVALAVSRAIQKSPEARFSTCEEFADGLIEGVGAGNSSSQLARPHVKKRRRPSSESSMRRDSDRTVGKKHSRRTVSRGTPGAVKCPACRVLLPLKPMHRGKKGRCIHCRVRLAVSRDLTQLTEVTTENSDWYSSGSGKLPPMTRKQKQSSEKSSSESASGELYFGEKVFGWQLGRRAALVVAALLVMVVLCATIYLTVYVTGESDEDRVKREVESAYRSME